MEFTVASWVFVIVFTGITLISVFDDRQKGNVLVRFQRYIAIRLSRSEGRQIDRTFQQRVIDPMIGRLNVLVNTRISESAHRKLAMKLLNAGYPLKATPAEFLVKNAITVVVLTLATIGILIYMKKETAQIVSYSFMALAIFPLFISLLFKESIQKRITALERELPELLDYIQVAVEAGLSIDSSIERIVAEQSKGIMAYEFKIYLHDVKMGLTRSEALHQLHSRTDSRYVKNFTDGVTQAVKTGMPIGDILKIIRKDIYEDIRGRAEKRAYKAPVLMMIPMAVFILPTVFIITCMPAVLKMVTEFSKMGGG